MCSSNKSENLSLLDQIWTNSVDKAITLAIGITEEIVMACCYHPLGWKLFRWTQLPIYQSLAWIYWVNKTIMITCNWILFIRILYYTYPFLVLFLSKNSRTFSFFVYTCILKISGRIVCDVLIYIDNLTYVIILYLSLFALVI